MAAALDVDDSLFVHLRAHKMIPLRHKGQGREHIHHGHSLGSLLNPQHLGSNVVPQLAEQAVFQSCQLLFGPQNRILQLLQLRRNIALRVGQGLLAHPGPGNHILVGVGDLQIITEYFIVLDFQIFDTCLVPLLGLQLCQPALALGLGLPEAIHILMIAVLDDVAVPDGDGRILLNSFFNHSLDIRQRIQILPQLTEKRRGKIFQ